MTALSLLFSLLLAQADDPASRRVWDACQVSVVRLSNEECSGTGLVVDAEGGILTNAHVVVSPLPFRVEAELAPPPGGRGRIVRFTDVKLVGVDPRLDLALLRIGPHRDLASLVPLRTLGGPALVGDPVFALGFPKGRAKTLLPGKILGVNQVADTGGYTEISCAIEPGCSGGPVVDLEGRLLGVTTFKIVDRDGNRSGMMIPVEKIRTDTFIPLDRREPDPGAAAESLRLGDRLLKLVRKGNSSASDLALRAFQTAVLEDPANPETHFLIGMIQNSIDRHSLACAHLFRSLQIQPWPNEKGHVYNELAVSLIALQRPAEAADVLWEGISKYPREAPILWDTLAVLSQAEAAWSEALIASRCSLLTYAPRPEKMNGIYQEAWDNLKAEERVRVRQTESGLRELLEKAETAARNASKAGRAFMLPETARLIQTFTSVQKLEVVVASKPAPGRWNLLDSAPAPEAAPAGGAVENSSDAAFLLSRIRVALEHQVAGRREKAREILAGIVKSFPDRPETEQARQLLEKLPK